MQSSLQSLHSKLLESIEAGLTHDNFEIKAKAWKEARELLEYYEFQVSDVDYAQMKKHMEDGNYPFPKVS